MARSGGTEGPLDQAQDCLSGGRSPVPTHDERTEQRNFRAGEEVKRLRAWTFKRYGDEARHFKTPGHYLGRGAEHEVYLHVRGTRVIKITRKSEPASYGFGISLNHDGQGATAGEYLNRLQLQNQIFNDDVRLEGVHAATGNTRIITSQPFIDGDPAAPAQIDVYMDGKGFEKLAEGAYYDPVTGVLVHDLFPRNVVVTPQGKVRAIDPAIMRAEPELAEYLRVQTHKNQGKK